MWSFFLGFFVGWQAQDCVSKGLRWRPQALLWPRLWNSQSINLATFCRPKQVTRLVCVGGMAKSHCRGAHIKDLCPLSKSTRQQVLLLLCRPRLLVVQNFIYSIEPLFHLVHMWTLLVVSWGRWGSSVLSSFDIRGLDEAFRDLHFLFFLLNQVCSLPNLFLFNNFIVWSSPCYLMK